MEEKTVFIRLKEWCGQEKNQWKIAPFFLCFFVAFFWFMSTPNGSIQRSMLFQGYSLQELTAPIERIGREKVGHIQIETYSMELPQENGKTEHITWRVECWPHSCYAAQVK